MSPPSRHDSRQEVYEITEATHPSRAEAQDKWLTFLRGVKTITHSIDESGENLMMLNRRRVLCALVTSTASLLSACATPVPQIDRGQMVYSDAVEAAASVQAFHGTNVRGELKVLPFANGVRITGDLSGFPRSGAFGFQVAQAGDCSTPEAAGAIFNPLQTRRGVPSVGEHMLGDLPNIEASSSGAVTLNLQVTGLTLGGGGYKDIAGRSLVFSEISDDPGTLSAGTVGRRIACAVISVTNPPPIEG